MPKQEVSRVSGFAGYNSGQITNCYSAVELRVKTKAGSGFAGENSGSISKGFRIGGIDHLAGGFCGNNSGNMEDSCYFFHKEKENSKRLKKLQDVLKGQRLDEVKEAEDAARLGFDMEEIWEYTGKRLPLRFISEEWAFDVAQSSKYAEKPVVISSADDLWDLAKRINDGDRELASAHIVMEEDIDLGGKEWIPIGRDRLRAFTGLFDGAGHTVKNFVIKDKKMENKGFFGFLKGEIYNLLVDCRIKGGSCCGGIAALCEGGTIGCCAAIVVITGKKGIYGGLVGGNTGTIFQSYTAGKVWGAAIFWWWLLPWLPGLILLLILFMLVVVPRFMPNLLGLSMFAPVPYDQDQIPIPNGSISPSGEGNFVSFQFEQKIDVSLATGLCKFGFKNPGNSNHNIVVQLQFTDAQAVRVMGSTGRSVEEQQRLSGNPEYDPESNRTVIAESGAIRPGYQLEDLRLVAHANGATVPPGDYNAMVYLIFYDIQTNNRAMLESQLPVIISVHE